MSHFPFTANIVVNYYLGNFFFNGFWDSGWSYVDGDNGYLRKMPMSSSISAGWASRGWNIRLSLVNPLQSSWNLSKDTLTTRWYDSCVTQFGSDYHRCISLAVVYTFNYGKKVNQSGELSGDKNISTSILKWYISSIRHRSILLLKKNYNLVYKNNHRQNIIKSAFRWCLF